MQIEINNQPLDLSDSFAVTIEDKSPVFSDRGSQTIPVTIPATPRNLRLTGFPQRTDYRRQPLPPGTRARISTGAWTRTGQVNIVSAGASDGITLNIGFDNSEAYSQWMSTSMRSLKLPTERYASASELCTHLEQVWSQGLQSTAPYALPEVIIDNPSLTQGGETVYYPLLLNTVSDGHLVTAQRTETQVVDGKATRVALPVGYGVTPMLYLWRVIELVFATFGFTVESNPFADDPSLRRLILLNNTADAAVTGTLAYADLMPDATVEEFLSSLWARFGMTYHINGATRRVSIALLRDILTAAPQADITLNLTSPPLVTYQQPRQVRLAAQTSFEGAQPPAERYEDFIRNQPTPTEVTRFTDEQTASLVFERTTMRWYRWDRTNVANKFVGSSHFNWDRQTTSVDDYDVTSPDESIPMQWLDNRILPAFLAGPSHRHTYIRLGNTTQQQSDDTQTPIAFAIALPTSAGATHLGATITPYDNAGQHISVNSQPFPFSLIWQGHDGLFARFWQSYDASLRHAMHQVEVAAELSHPAIAALSPLRPVLIQGQRMLIETLQYVVASQPATHTHLLQATVTLRTLRPLQPMDLDAEQQVFDGRQTSSGLMWLQESSTLSVRTSEVAARRFSDAKTMAIEDYDLVGTVSVEQRGQTIDYDVYPDNDPEVRDNPPLQEGLTLQRQYSARVTTYVWIGGNDGRGEYRQDIYAFTDDIGYTVVFKAVNLG